VPAAIILIALAISTTTAQTIATFDPPGGGTGPGQGTSALNIDPSGTIIGFTRDSNNARHAFIRSKDGSFTVFDAPGAGTGSFQGTRAYAINSDGTITGFFFDSVTVAHAYVRSKHGVITVFDAPGAGTGPGQGTIFFSPEILNNDGEIAGHYVDSGGVSHGFLRDENGVITTFDAPGAGTGNGQGTFSFAISQGGQITGFYFDGTNANHGFLRHENGVITTVDVPGASNVVKMPFSRWAVLYLHRAQRRPQSLVGDDSGRLWRLGSGFGGPEVTVRKIGASPTRPHALVARSRETRCSGLSNLQSPPRSEQCRRLAAPGRGPCPRLEHRTQRRHHADRAGSRDLHLPRQYTNPSSLHSNLFKSSAPLNHACSIVVPLSDSVFRM
jgi:hypothetical protein